MPVGYVPIRELGRGGLGVVHLARHVNLDRLVAVKRILAPQAAGRDAVARFRREGQILARLSHPNIVCLYDVAYVDDVLLLIMEYVDGSDLRTLVRRGGLEQAARASILADVGAALEHAAAREVVHRDLKPANVFVVPVGRAKVGDFGIGRVLGDLAVFRTTEGLGAGTPTYMAPEQILAEPDLDSRTDAYSYAVMAYELLVGTLPLSGVSVPEVIDAHLFATPPDPRSRLPGFPDTVAEALLAGLAKDPAQRPPVATMATAIAAVAASAWPALPAPESQRPFEGATDPETPSAHGGTTPAVHTGAPTSVDGTDRDALVEMRSVVASEPNAAQAQVGSSMPHLVAIRSRDEPPPSTRPGGDPKAGRLSDSWVEVPVFRPPAAGRAARTRLPRWALVLSAALVLGAALTLGAFRGWRGQSLQVENVSVVLDGADQGACPAATFTFAGSIITNGHKGRLRLQWIGPDGEPQTPFDVPVADGQLTTGAVLRLEMVGDEPITGRAQLHLLAPGFASTASPPVVYTCP